jgi:hypothetical protein
VPARAAAWAAAPSPCGGLGRRVPQRCVALGANVVLHVTLDPRRPRAYPVGCRFTGPDSAVAPLRTALLRSVRAALGCGVGVADGRRRRSAAARWDDAALLRSNLEAALGQPLPPPHAPHMALDVECGVCYALRLDAGTLPDTACDDARCGKVYHVACLRECLRAAPGTRQSFQTLLGAAAAGCHGGVD